MGAPLFYSVGKKLHLSDAGRTMLKATHEIYEILNQTTDEIQQSTSATVGKINIGLLSSIEDSAFNAFIAHYYDLNPEVEITLRMMTRHEIWEALENNQIDLAIMNLPDETIKNWKPYASKKILDEQLLFLHHDNSLANRKRLHFKDTLAEPWVTYPDDYFLGQLLHEAYKNQMVDFPHVVAHFTTPYQLTPRYQPVLLPLMLIKSRRMPLPLNQRFALRPRLCIARKKPIFRGLPTSLRRLTHIYPRKIIYRGSAKTVVKLNGKLFS